MYIVIELQKIAETQIAVPAVIQREDWNEAESEYCRVRSVAAISEVPQHTVVFMRDDGYLYDYRCYTHAPATPPESGPEQS